LTKSKKSPGKSSVPGNLKIQVDSLNAGNR